MRRFRDDVKALTGGAGVDVTYDGVGGDAITVESMRCSRFGARILIAGSASQRASPLLSPLPPSLQGGLRRRTWPRAEACEGAHSLTCSLPT